MSAQPKLQKSSSPEKIALKMRGVYTSPSLPAGFRLADASAGELDRYGFPEENPYAKDRLTSPVQALIERKWTPRNRILPVLKVERGVTHLLRPKRARIGQSNASAQTTNNWSGAVVKAANTAPLPKPGSPTDGYPTAFNNQQHVNYIGANNHVYELYYRDSWKFNDLTALAGAPNAGASSALDGYATTFNNQQHVNFIGDDRHVYELFYDNSWKLNDLTKLSGLHSTAHPTSPLAGYETSFNEQQHVIFLDLDNHIHELFYDSQWHDNDLTDLTHAPVALRASSIAAYQTSFNKQQHIIFQTFDSHIHELVYDGSWRHNDLSKLAGPGVPCNEPL